MLSNGTVDLYNYLSVHYARYLFAVNNRNRIGLVF